MLWKKSKNRTAAGSMAIGTINEIEQARQDIILANLERMRRKEHAAPTDSDIATEELVEPFSQKQESPKTVLTTVVTEVLPSNEDSDFVSQIMRQIVSSEIKKWQATSTSHTSQQKSQTP